VYFIPAEKKRRGGVEKKKKARPSCEARKISTFSCCLPSGNMGRGGGGDGESLKEASLGRCHSRLFLKRPKAENLLGRLQAVTEGQGKGGDTKAPNLRLLPPPVGERGTREMRNQPIHPSKASKGEKRVQKFEMTGARLWGNRSNLSPS